MFKWEIYCCDQTDQITDGLFPQPMNEITVFVYAETEDAGMDVARGKVVREHYQAVECVEELDPEAYPSGIEDKPA